MSRSLPYFSVLCTGVCLGGLGLTQTSAAQDSGPVREGLRRTGEAVVEGGRRVGEGVARVGRGAADAARETAQTLTGDRSARWRMRRHNERWWYYSPEGNWMYRQNDQWNTYQAGQNADMQPPQVDPAQMQSQFNQQQDRQVASQTQQATRYETGYRGIGGMATQSLMYDQCGRPFVCENGRRVYVDPSAVQSDQYAATSTQTEGQSVEAEKSASRPQSEQQTSRADQSSSQPQSEQQTLQADQSSSQPQGEQRSPEGAQSPAQPPSDGQPTDFGQAPSADLNNESNLDATPGGEIGLDRLDPPE